MNTDLWEAILLPTFNILTNPKNVRQRGELCINGAPWAPFILITDYFPTHR